MILSVAEIKMLCSLAFNFLTCLIAQRGMIIQKKCYINAVLYFAFAWENIADFLTLLDKMIFILIYSGSLVVDASMRDEIRSLAGLFLVLALSRPDVRTVCVHDSAQSFLTLIRNYNELPHGLIRIIAKCVSIWNISVFDNHIGRCRLI